MSMIVDMHCHILPGLDDGAKNEQETLEMLKIAYEEGIRVIIATPHHHKKRGICTCRQYKEALEKTRKLAYEIDPGFRIIPGMEVYFDQDVINKLQNKNLQTMGNSQYLLVEFSPDAESVYIRQSMQQIEMEGYTPILAHVERYSSLLESIEDVKDLVDMGVYIQVNAGSITGDSGRTVKRFTKQLLERHLVHFVGTDAHSSGRRRPKIKECAEYVSKKFGEDYAKDLFQRNGMRVIKNKTI